MGGSAEALLPASATAPANSQLKGPACGSGREIEAPLAQAVGVRVPRFAAERHGDSFVGRGNAPDVDRKIALDDHVRAKNFRKRNLREQT